MKIFMKLDYLKSLFCKLRAFTSDNANMFYINGPATLPPPLESDEEQIIIERLIEGDINARQVLIEHNLRLVVYIAKKFESSGVAVEDLISIGTIGLIKSIGTYKSDKNIKLATYASRCIENEILMFMRKAGAQRSEISIDEPLNVDWDGNELLLSDILDTGEDSVGKDIERDEDERELHEAVERLDEREKLIIKLRYGLDGNPEKTQKEVADMMGISQSYISRLEKKIILELRDVIVSGM